MRSKYLAVAPAASIPVASYRHRSPVGIRVPLTEVPRRRARLWHLSCENTRYPDRLLGQPVIDSPAVSAHPPLDA